LGLSMAHQIIQNHRGIVQVESVENKGTTFTLKFPV
jgi:signal transduction histidine kinase